MNILIFLIVGGLFLLIWLIQSGQLRFPANRDYIDPDLLRAARGNAALARRLLEQARQRYPGKSESWYVEKIIYDLRRDHGVAGTGKRNFFNFRGWTTRETRENLFLVGTILWIFNGLTHTIRNLLGR